MRAGRALQAQAAKLARTLAQRMKTVKKMEEELARGAVKAATKATVLLAAAEKRRLAFALGGLKKHTEGRTKQLAALWEGLQVRIDQLTSTAVVAASAGEGAVVATARLQQLVRDEPLDVKVPVPVCLTLKRPRPHGDTLDLDCDDEFTSVVVACTLEERHELEAANLAERIRNVEFRIFKFTNDQRRSGTVHSRLSGLPELLEALLEELLGLFDLTNPCTRHGVLIHAFLDTTETWLDSVRKVVVLTPKDQCRRIAERLVCLEWVEHMPPVDRDCLVDAWCRLASALRAAGFHVAPWVPRLLRKAKASSATTSASILRLLHGTCLSMRGIIHALHAPVGTIAALAANPTTAVFAKEFVRDAVLVLAEVCDTMVVRQAQSRFRHPHADEKLLAALVSDVFTAILELDRLPTLPTPGPEGRMDKDEVSRRVGGARTLLHLLDNEPLFGQAANVVASACLRNSMFFVKLLELDEDREAFLGPPAHALMRLMGASAHRGSQIVATVRGRFTAMLRNGAGAFGALCAVEPADEFTLVAAQLLAVAFQRADSPALDHETLLEVLTCVEDPRFCDYWFSKVLAAASL